MRTLAITQNMTIDGVIDLSDDWFSPAAGDDLLAAAHRAGFTR